MKRLVIALGILLCLESQASAQYSAEYGYNPGQAAYGQYAQPGYGGAYGQGYGQPYGYDPSAYTQSGQANANTGQNPYANYGYGQYGQQQNGYNYADPSYGANPNQYGQYGQQQQAAPARPAARSKKKARRNAAPQATQASNQPSNPYIRTPQGHTQQPDKIFQQPGSLVTGEIYWDGEGSDYATGQNAQSAPSAQTPAPIIREAKPAANNAPLQAQPQTTSKRAKREKPSATAMVSEAPAHSRKLQWGKQEETQAVSEAPSVENRPKMKWGKQEQPTPTVQSVRPAMKWGLQEKPAAVTAEPGSFQGSSQSAKPSSSQTQADSNSGKKFQWGKTN